ncbi:hypothetical protein BJX70DRAFT_406352 [Aspergillus crustosus]
MSHLSNVPGQQQGQFKPSVQPAGSNKQPHGTFPGDKHAVGVKASPADRAPEFHAQTQTPGTAPSGSSYQANPIDHPGEQALNPNVERSHGKESVKTTAEQSLQGATSKDVHRGLGKPISGQTTTELRENANKHPRKGLEGAVTGVKDEFGSRTEQTLAKKPTAAEGTHAEGIHHKRG